MPEIVESTISTLLQGKDLSFSVACEISELIYSEKISHNQSKSILTLLAQKGEALPEIKGFLTSLRKFEPVYKQSLKGILDTCGTGGDHSGTINISTISALVIAAAGGRVAKHGNRALSSLLGSSDFMETLGISLEKSLAQSMRSLKQNNFCYLHAPAHHPIFTKLHSLRRQIKTRTIFNLMGPLIHPLNIDFQLVGVSRIEWLDLYAKLLSGLKRKRALVVYSDDGMDEISIYAQTQGILIEKGKSKKIVIDPKKLKISGQHPENIRFKDKKSLISKALEVLKGKDRGDNRKIVILNSAAGLWVSGVAGSLEEGIQLAEQMIRTGKAFEVVIKAKELK